MQQSMQLNDNLTLATQTNKATITKKASNKQNDETPIDYTKIFLDNISSTAYTIARILGGNTKAATLLNELNALEHGATNGNPTKIESALIMQSKLLSVIFNRMIEMGVETQSLESLKTLMDIALKAQNQSRKTLLALNTIQNPQQATIVKQQNVAFNQQVNNNAAPKPKIKKINLKNQLIREDKYATLDDRRAQATIQFDQATETLATFNGAENITG